jgi:hypothetical protein
MAAAVVRNEIQDVLLAVGQRLRHDGQRPHRDGWDRHPVPCRRAREVGRFVPRHADKTANLSGLRPIR